MKKTYLFLILLILIILGITAGYFFLNKDKSNKNDRFEIDTLFLKAGVVQGGVSVNNVKITSKDTKLIYFSISVEGEKQLVNLSEYEFNLNPGEAHNLQIVFDSGTSEPGIYVGKMIVSYDGISKKIPFILEIEANDILFDSNINLFYKAAGVYPGDKLNTEIKIFDLSNIGKSQINFIYFIKDFNGNTIIQESENIVVDSKLDYSKTIDIPENIKTGDYILGTIIKYKDSAGTSSSYFKIIKKEKTIYSNNVIFLVAGLFVLIFLFAFFFFIYFILSRDRLLNELKNQYKKEIRIQKELIKQREKSDYGKLKNSLEKGIYKKALKKAKKKRLRIIKESYKKRVKEFRKIKKKGKGNALKRQIEKWKQEGYDTGVLEEKVKLPDIKEIRQKIKSWKRKGYDTSVLKNNI